jgi:hypothetical protein
MIDQAVEELVRLVGVKAACRAGGRPRSCHDRWHRKSPPPPKPERGAAMPPWALSEVEGKQVLGILHDPEQVDEARPPGTPSCWMGASTWPGPAPCIACWAARARS